MADKMTIGKLEKEFNEFIKNNPSSGYTDRNVMFLANKVVELTNKIIDLEEKLNNE